MNQSPIFLVEDNGDDEELTRRALKKSNVQNELIVARDGEEALTFIDDSGKSPPALVLLDLKLPKVSGIEVLRHIREVDRWKHVPVVVLSSSGEEKDIVDSYSLCANSYIRKPVKFSEFVDIIANIGLYWLMVNRLPATLS